MLFTNVGKPVLRLNFKKYNKTLVRERFNIVLHIPFQLKCIAFGYNNTLCCSHHHSTAVAKWSAFQFAVDFVLNQTSRSTSTRRPLIWFLVNIACNCSVAFRHRIFAFHGQHYVCRLEEFLGNLKKRE